MNAQFLHFPRRGCRLLWFSRGAFKTLKSSFTPTPGTEVSQRLPKPEPNKCDNMPEKQSL